MKQKKSFFERLAGVVSVDDTDEMPVETHYESSRAPEEPPQQNFYANEPMGPSASSVWVDEEENTDAELSLDLYQTPSEIIIQTMTAGVRPDELDISISRDSVSIQGKRLPPSGVTDDDYFIKELYWGAFSRTIDLPEEVEAEEAEAMEKNGLLVIRIPKIDKEKTRRLKVRSI